MFTSKINFILIFFLLPFFSSAEWASSDRSSLEAIQGNTHQLESDVGYIEDILAYHLANTSMTIPDVPLVDNIWYIRDFLSQIATDLYVIRNTQLSSIMSNVDASEGHLKYMRDEFTEKLDNLKLIATALSGQNAESAYVNLGFDSIGKNVQRLTDTTAGISNNVSNIRENLANLTYKGEDGLDYLRIAPTWSGDFSIITNAILGSAFLNPWVIGEGYNSYYDLLEDYKNGEIDSNVFIAEMGLYNWLAGLNFGDWWVDTPDNEDMDDSTRWGIVENAKMEWAPLVESTAFPPHAISTARYFLYGTRDLTDRFNEYFEFVQSNEVASIEEDLEEPTTLEELEEVPEDILPEVDNEQTSPVTEILETDVQNDQFTTQLENFISQIEGINEPSSSSSSLTITFNPNLLGTSVSDVSITIEQQQKAKIMIDTATNYVVNGFKIAVMIFIASCCATTLMSKDFEIKGMTS